MVYRLMALKMGPRFYCGKNGILSQPHVHYGLIVKTGCFDPMVLSINILADQINTTTTIGDTIPKEDIALYSHVYIRVFQLDSGTMQNANPIIPEILLLDNVKTGFRYCEPKTKPAYISVFAIFGQPFDVFTWLCIGTSMAGIAYYFNLKLGSILDSAFNVTKLILQRTYNQRFKFCVVFLVGFFFLEFFFLSTATEKMIAPRKPFIIGSLSALLLQGYYLFEVSANMLVQDRTGYAKYRWEALQMQYDTHLVKFLPYGFITDIRLKLRISCNTQKN